jgi:hypothetical protein
MSTLSLSFSRLSLISPELSKNLQRVLPSMISIDLIEQLERLFHQKYFHGRTAHEIKNLMTFLNFEKFVISLLLDQFSANKEQAYRALEKNMNQFPRGCTFWQHYEDRIKQAAHAHAVKETLAFLESLCEQKPGLPSDQQVFTQRLELVGSVNDLCRQILQNDLESAILDLDSSDSGLCVQVPKIDCESVGSQISQNTRSFVSFDNLAALAADEAAAAAKAADEAAIPYD